MVLDIFGGKSRTPGPASLLQRRGYEKAIAEIRAELQKRKKDERLRLQLADMLVLVGKPKEAVEVLNALADDLAWDGFAAKGIAVLKKIEKIDPGRSEVEEKLAYLINQKSRPAGDPWAAGGGAPASGTEEIGLDLGPARAVAAPEPPPAPAPAADSFDLELSSGEAAAPAARGLPPNISSTMACLRARRD